MATVPDPRVEALCAIYQPKKVTQAALQVVDTPGLSRSHEGSAAKLATIREAGCLLVVVSALPENVYLTFDVDGLDPQLCPGTGTPVPGGLLWHEVTALLEAVVDSGRTIVGGDLVEVAPQEGDREWNANVGARLLYRMIGSALRTRA